LVKISNYLKIIAIVEMGGWGVSKTKNFVENVIIKGRVNFRSYWF